jgi:hypothetical protein
LAYGGKVAIERPRLRGFDGKEQALPSWERATTEDWLGKYRPRTPPEIKITNSRPSTGR